MLYTREIMKDIEKILFREEYIILSGARQTGKTSIMRMLKASLEEKGHTCTYFNLENPEYVKLFNAHPFHVLEAIPPKKAKQYVFIDEIQYLENPSRFLKLLFDEKRDRVKIICSGSSSFYIDKKFKDSLAGRKFLFEVYPLNFEEFLMFKEEELLLKHPKKKLSLYLRKKLRNLWREYRVFGGYPKVVLAEDEELKRNMLEEIATSYVKKDIRDAGIRNEEKYFFLLKLLSSQTGQLINRQEISSLLGIAEKTVEEYFYVMQKSYHIAFIRPFYKSIRKELIKMPKVYFYDMGLRNFFVNDFSEIGNRPDKGAYLENIVFREFLREVKSVDKIRFWRTQDGKEIDFIVGGKAFEVKTNAQKQTLKKYNTFIEEYPDIQFSFLTQEGVLEKFYGWKEDFSPLETE